jgi:flagellar hook-length control protein FliK
MEKANGHRLVDLALGGSANLAGAGKHHGGADFMAGFSQAVQKVQEKRKTSPSQGPREGHHAITRPTDAKRIHKANADHDLQDSRPAAKIKRPASATAKKPMGRSDLDAESTSAKWKNETKAHPKTVRDMDRVRDRDSDSAPDLSEANPKQSLPNQGHTEAATVSRNPKSGTESQGQLDCERSGEPKPLTEENHSPIAGNAEDGEISSENQVAIPEEWNDWSAVLTLAMLHPNEMAETEIELETGDPTSDAQGLNSQGQGIEGEALDPFLQEKPTLSEQPSQSIPTLESQRGNGGKIADREGSPSGLSTQDGEWGEGSPLPASLGENANEDKAGPHRVSGGQPSAATSGKSEALGLVPKSAHDPLNQTAWNPRTLVPGKTFEKAMEAETFHPTSPAPVALPSQTIHPDALRVLHSQPEAAEEEPVIITAESLRSDRALFQKSEASQPASAVSPVPQNLQNQSHTSDQGGKQPSEFQLDSNAMSGLKWGGNRSESTPAQSFSSLQNEGPNQAGANQSRLQDIQAMLKREMDARATSLWQTGKEEIHIQLTPEHLGRVRVALELHQGNVTAHIQVQSEAAKQAVDQGMQQLKENLQMHGFRIEGLSVSVEDRHAGLFNPQGENSERYFNSRGGSDHGEEDGKEPVIDTPATMRRMGYNTLEITA